MPQTDLKSALRKIKVVFQQSKFEVVFQIKVYLKQTINQNCQTIHMSNYAKAYPVLNFLPIVKLITNLFFKNKVIFKYKKNEIIFQVKF